MWEVVKNSTPSPASGVVAAEFTSETEIIWLVEPKRSTIVERWSGTMEHPNHPDNKIGQTMSAFAHFSWICSKQTMVLVDLQSESYAPDLDLK